MFGGVVPEFLAVTKGRWRVAVNSLACFSDVDDGGNVVGVAIDRDAAFDDVERETFGFEVAVVDGNERGKLRSGGMSGREDAIGIAAVFGDVVVDPVDGFGDVLKNRDHLDVRQQAISGGNENEAIFREPLRLDL